MGDPRTFGQTYELGGPKTYTLEELMKFVAATLGRRRAVIGLPGPLGELQALVLEHMPGKPVTRDNLASMRVANVCAHPFPAVFGFQPTALEPVVQAYLAGSQARSRYVGYRHHAGR